MAQYNVFQYLNEKTFNNQLAGEGETIAPFVVTWEQVKADYMDRDNIRTWTLRGGRKVLVAFMVVKVEEFAGKMKLFNYMADGDHDHHMEDADSLDKMVEDACDPDKKGMLPRTATVQSAEAIVMAGSQIEDLIAAVTEMDSKSGAILNLIAAEVRENGKLNRGHILKQLGLGKSQGYEAILTAQRLAREYRDKNW